jgi:hypothetical protein
MTSSKAVYLRVSRKDLDEEKQFTAINAKFDVESAIIYREKVSAYEEEAQEKRIEFQNLKKQILDGEINELYIFSVERLERNIVRLFEFYFFCEAHDCKIYSVMQDIPNKEPNEKPLNTFLRYINVLLFGYKGQEESFTTSYRTKSAVEVIKNNTYSYQGNKWGKQFKDLQGNNVSLSQSELERIQSIIKKEINKHESIGERGYYKQIQDLISKQYKITISKAYISVLKNGRNN